MIDYLQKMFVLAVAVSYVQAAGKTKVIRKYPSSTECRIIYY